MPEYSQPCLVAENLSCAVADRRWLFKNISISVFPGDHIALIGKNGIGKSTLLRCLSEQQKPIQGTISSQATALYVSQLSSLASAVQDLSVLDFLSANTDAWWEIERVLETVFGTVLELASPLRYLSGGEMMQLLLAIALWRKPDLLLLDEPTNHLDYVALEQLHQALSQFKGALIIVSHKPFFLDQVVNTVWELTPKGIGVYGGHYSFYQAQKQLERDAAVRSHEVARKELKKTKATVLKEQKRAAQSIRNGGRYVVLNREARGMAGTMKNWAKLTAGRLKVKHEKAMNAAAQKVAATKVHVNRATHIQLETKSQKHRNLIDVCNADLFVGAQLLLKDMDFRVVSGDRIAIAGPNGSGKSSFIKAMLRLDSVATLKNGDIQIAKMKTVYLDQHYALVDRRQTVLENMLRANSALAYQLVRQQLGHFLFFNDDVYKSASVLSGGELASLAIAMITISELDLLVLDEPTNNLDIETVDHIVQGLRQYEGALCVISHDLGFLSRIGIQQSFQILDASLKTTAYLPNEQSHYYEELLSRSNA